MSMQVSYKKQIVLMSLFIIILFAICEIILNVYDFTSYKCEFLKHDEVFPNYTDEELNNICKTTYDLKIDPINLEFNPNQISGNVKINNFGFRGEDITREKTENTYRIFMIGGSTTFGVVVNDNETIPYYLQEILNEKNHDFTIEVINAGILSSWSYNEVEKIKKKIVNFEPDMIIIYDGWNDVSFGKPESEIQSTYDFRIFGEDEELNVVEQIRAVLRESKLISAANRALFFGNSELLHYNRTVVPFDNSLLEIKVIEWKNRISEICEIGNSKGFSTVVIIQPMAGSGNRTLSDTEKLYFIRYDHENLLKGLSEYAEALNEVNSCSLTLDFRNVLDEVNHPVYFDQGHMGSFGNEFIAKKIAEKISPILN